MIGSIIIVNYNTNFHLQACLNSIQKLRLEDKFEVIVIDNNSTDRSIEEFPNQFPQPYFYFRDVNDGFGSGCDFGARQSSGEYLLFVNPDIVFYSDVITEMTKFMNNNHQVGACSPVFTNFENQLVYTYNKFPNYRWEFFEFLGSGNEKEEIRLLNNEKIVNRSEEPLYVDWTTGACLMVRSDVFNKLNGFDKDYFLYYEDTDLQYRIHKQGLKIACLPYLRVKHFVNSSVRSVEGEDVYHYHLNRSKLIYYYKHFHLFKRNILRSLMISGILLRMTALNFRKRYSDKKKQKMKQYKKILKVYLSSKDQLIKS
ncbi:MAG: glycosyltransferase family 2 protein [Ignavibacteria bacterium]